MSGRAGQLSRAEQRRIGEAVRAARAAGTRWKVLERIYGRERSRLHRLARDAAAASAREMQQQSGEMQHLRDGEDREAA